MNKMILSSVFFLLTATSIAQEKEGDVSNVFKVTFLNPGISYEARIARLQTIYAQVFMNTSARVTETVGQEADYDFFFDPALTLQYRYYYNFKKRQSRGLRTAMNNLNYVSGDYEVVFTELPIAEYDYQLGLRPMHRIGAVWGMQRNYKGRFALDLNIGPGYMFTTSTYVDPFGQKFKQKESGLILMGQINIGFWLNKKKEPETK